MKKGKTPVLTAQETRHLLLDIIDCRTTPDEVESVNIEQVVRKIHIGGLITSFELKSAA